MHERHHGRRFPWCRSGGSRLSAHHRGLNQCLIAVHAPFQGSDQILQQRSFATRSPGLGQFLQMMFLLPMCHPHTTRPPLQICLVRHLPSQYFYKLLQTPMRASGEDRPDLPWGKRDLLDSVGAWPHRHARCTPSIQRFHAIPGQCCSDHPLAAHLSGGRRPGPY